MPDSGVLPLVVLPDTCSLQRFVTRALTERGVPYMIAHSASGIGGLHLALAAGLGATCLNASAVPEGAVPLADAIRLPPLPEVEFGLIPPVPGEAAIVSEVRHMLAEQFR